MYTLLSAVPLTAPMLADESDLTRVKRDSKKDKDKKKKKKKSAATSIATNISLVLVAINLLFGLFFV